MSNTKNATMTPAESAARDLESAVQRLLDLTYSLSGHEEADHWRRTLGIAVGYARNLAGALPGPMLPDSRTALSAALDSLEEDL